MVDFPLKLSSTSDTQVASKPQSPTHTQPETVNATSDQEWRWDTQDSDHTTLPKAIKSNSLRFSMIKDQSLSHSRSLMISLIIIQAFMRKKTAEQQPKT